MSQYGPLILLGILILSLLLLVGVLPFAQRSLAARNRTKYRQRRHETAEMDQALLDSAERLRPFRNMQAHSYQEQREAVRTPLLKARVERQEISRRFEQLRLVQPPPDGWPGAYFIRQPSRYITIPLDTWHLWQIGRSLEKINESLKTAAEQQNALHHITDALEEAASILHKETLPTLARALANEKDAGIGKLQPFDERLHNLRQRTANLTGSLRAGPAADDQKTDRLALELEEITELSAILEKEVREIYRWRKTVDELRQQTESQHNTLLQALPPNRTTPNLAPIIEHIDFIFQDATAQRANQKFDECERYLNTASQFIDLNWRLFQAGTVLEQLVEIQNISPLAERIRTVLTLWPPLIQQAHQLVQPQQTGVLNGITTVAGTADHILGQANQILTEHNQILGQAENRANQAMDTLALAWDNLLAILPLTQPDPLAKSYHALWPKREAARGVPDLLEQYIFESGNLTRQINATISTLQDQIKYVQETLNRLPKMLDEAQNLAGDWRSLQNLAEKLAALRVSLENISQDTFSVNTREGVDAHLSEFYRQAEKMSLIQEELRFESYEINRLDKIIRENWEAIQENPLGISEAKLNRAVKMTDTQYDRALSAERCKDARDALEKCLGYVEKLALN